MQVLDRLEAGHPGSTRFDVDRVEATITPEEFTAGYYLPQRPAVVSGIARDWRAARLWTPQYLLTNLEGSAVERSYNFDLGADHALARDCAVPALVEHIRQRPSVTTRAQPLRVWIARKGTHTRWHYDGNSLQVLNVQVRGRKRVSLISPQTPLPTFGLGQGARAGYTEIGEIRTPVTFGICEIGAGDMIFIPQHWYHSVVSLDDENLNINWVWTDTELLMRSQTPAAVREREYIAGLYLVGNLLRRFGYVPSWQEYVEAYGGKAGFGLTRELYDSVSGVAIVRRLFLEFGRALADGRYRRRNEQRELALNEGVRRSAYDYFQKASLAAGNPVDD